MFQHSLAMNQLRDKTFNLDNNINISIEVLLLKYHNK